MARLYGSYLVFFVSGSLYGIIYYVRSIGPPMLRFHLRISRDTRVCIPVILCVRLRALKPVYERVQNFMRAAVTRDYFSVVSLMGAFMNRPSVAVWGARWRVSLGGCMHIDSQYPSLFNKRLSAWLLVVWRRRVRITRSTCSVEHVLLVRDMLGRWSWLLNRKRAGFKDGQLLPTRLWPLMTRDSKMEIQTI